MNPPCNCTDPNPETCAACSALLQMPNLPTLAAAAEVLPGDWEAVMRAFKAGVVHITPVKGGFEVQSFTGKATYVVDTLTDRCSCPSRKPVCKHRMAIQLIEQAWARPACTSLPPVEQTLAWADALTLDSMPADIDFSQDTPTVNVQLKRMGMRRAQGWEDATLVTVVEFGKPFQLRVMPVAPVSKAERLIRAKQEMAELFN